MTTYKSWSEEVPQRVSIILTELTDAASKANVEITLALSVAALLILTIVERFRANHEQNELSANPVAHQRYTGVRNEHFLSSEGRVPGRGVAAGPADEARRAA